MLTPEEAKKAIGVLTAEDGDAALALITELLAAAAAGGAEEVSDEELAGDPAEEDTEETEELAGDPPDDVEENSKLAKLLMRATGTNSVGEAMSSLGKVIKQHAELHKQNEALHLSSKRDLIAQLIKLGVETPSTAWKGPAEKRVPVDRLMGESLDSMRGRIATLSKLRRAEVKAPTRMNRRQNPETPLEADEESIESQVARLSKRKLQAAKKMGITPEELVKQRAGAARRVVG